MIVLKNTFIITVLILFLSIEGCAEKKSESDKLFEILRTGNNLERIKGSEKLLEMGVSIEDKLIKHLEEESENKRKSIIWILGELGDKRNVRHITLFIDHSHDLTRFVLTALGKIGDRETIPIIVKKLRNKSRYIRTDAIRALGRIGDKKALPYLIEAKSDSDWHVREAAAIAFGKIGGPDAISHLKDMANNDPDSVVQISAEESLEMQF